MAVQSADLIFITIATSVFLIVFGLGLKTDPASVTGLLHQPGLAMRSLLAINIIMPALVLVIALMFRLHPIVKFTLLALAISPVPPLLPRAQTRAGGSEGSVFGLLVLTALVAIVFVPVAVIILGRVFDLEVRIAPEAVFRIVLRTVLVPLGLGILVQWRAAEVAEQIGKWVAWAGNLLLLVGMVFIVASAGALTGPLFGDGTLAAMAIVMGAGLLVGHSLGGPDIDDASALALACVCRHPGVALVIADANFPSQKPQVAATLLLYFAVSSIALIAYAHWRKRRLFECDGAVREKPGRRRAV